MAGREGKGKFGIILGMKRRTSRDAARRDETKAGGSQWSFPRFLVGCICSYTNCVGGWYFALNAFVCAVFAISTGMAAHAMGVDNKMLMAGMLLFGVVIGLFCLWGALRLIVGRMAFPECKSGCCCGMNDYSYRFGTWMGLIGWRKWLFVCSCGHLYEVHHGEWRCVGSLKLETEEAESHGGVSSRRFEN